MINQFSTMLLSKMGPGIHYLLTLLITFSGANCLAQELKLGDASDGNRSVPVHRIKLFDEDSSQVGLWDQPLLPFSTRRTCGGTCHDYATISGGWHFNANDPEVAPGRPGEPWIYYDPLTATQIPLSLRPWPGAWRPEQIGLSTLEFVTRFGRHLPGGGIAEDENAESVDNFLRWRVSGKLEVNCLGCHDIDPGYDQAEFASHIVRQNFRWAATAASGMATVFGSAKAMPDDYDIYQGGNPRGGDIPPPMVQYTPGRFNPRNEVLFDIRRKVPNEKCYFCHSTRYAPATPESRWRENEDVHLQAGMLCVDCHRNGLDHRMVRGYEGESPEKAAFTCKGCHLREQHDGEAFPAGMSAPRPVHAGLPAVHFEKLSCTACHSGPWPEQEVGRAKTSRSHALGTRRAVRADTSLPIILAPVYLPQQQTGKLAPHKMMYPSFWAYQKNDSLAPIAPDVVIPYIKALLQRDSTITLREWPRLDDSQLVGILDSLAAADSTRGVPVFVSGGRVYHADAGSTLRRFEHSSAGPYAWPIAHDVRPANQSLGSGGCDDCHSLRAGFYFSSVPVPTPLREHAGEARQMLTYSHFSRLYTQLFSIAFVFRPWLRGISLSVSALFILALLIYGGRGIAFIMERFGQNLESTNPLE